jgi:hypothetical protein
MILSAYSQTLEELACNQLEAACGVLSQTRCQNARLCSSRKQYIGVGFQIRKTRAFLIAAAISEADKAD